MTNDRTGSRFSKKTNGQYCVEHRTLPKTQSCSPIQDTSMAVPQRNVIENLGVTFFQITCKLLNPFHHHVTVLEHTLFTYPYKI